MKNCILALAATLLMPVLVSAQVSQGSGTGNGSNGDQATTTTTQSTQKDGQASTRTTVRTDDTQGFRFVRALTNVQVELTLTDQNATGTPTKKTVSMVVSSGNWGKIRSSADPRAAQVVGLNVDARPFVSTDGLVQLELTLYYYPPRVPGQELDRPTELNQSLTVVLQSGKPMLISQSADPGTDRKVTVEAKATVLK